MLNNKPDYSQKRIQETSKAWGPIYAKEGITLTREDAREISDSLWEFFSLLARWDKECRKSASSE
jgi:hypothetical protein